MKSRTHDWKYSPGKNTDSSLADPSVRIKNNNINTNCVHEIHTVSRYIFESGQFRKWGLL